MKPLPSLHDNSPHHFLNSSRETTIVATTKSNRRRKTVLSSKIRAERRRRLLIEALEQRIVLAIDWQNPLNAMDVTADGLVDPFDVLVVVNELNDPRLSDSRGRLTNNLPQGFPKSYVDTNGDEHVSLLDALIIVNALNRQTFSASIDSAAHPLSSTRLGFDQGLDGWNIAVSGGTQFGKGSVTAGSAVLREGNSFLVTTSHTFVVPSDPVKLQFTYRDLYFDTTDPDSINDAFEVALVDANHLNLVYTIGSGRDSFINFTEGETVALAPGVTHTGDTVDVDISHLLPGSSATVLFRLVNNDQDENTSVRIETVDVISGSDTTPPTVIAKIPTDNATIVVVRAS